MAQKRKKDWKDIEASDVSRQYRKLQRHIEVLRHNKVLGVQLMRLSEKAPSIVNEQDYVEKNFYLILNYEDFALLDAYHCQYRGRRISQKHYENIRGIFAGLEFMVTNKFGPTDLWTKDYVDKVLEKGNKKCR